MKKLIVLLVVLFTTNAYANIRTFGNLPEAVPTTNGEAIFQDMKCVMCHGYSGNGDGLLSKGLDPKPRNFTSWDQMLSKTDIELYDSIKNGIEGSAMPAFSYLTDSQIEDLIGYVRSFLYDAHKVITLCANQDHFIITDAQWVATNINEDWQESKNGFLFFENITGGILVKVDPIKTMKHLRKINKKLVREYILIKETDGHRVLVALRITNCLK
jgi:cytochrome c5